MQVPIRRWRQCSVLIGLFSLLGLLLIGMLRFGVAEAQDKDKKHTELAEDLLATLVNLDEFLVKAYHEGNSINADEIINAKEKLLRFRLDAASKKEDRMFIYLETIRKVQTIEEFAKGGEVRKTSTGEIRFGRPGRPGDVLRLHAFRLQLMIAFEKESLR